MQEKGTERLAAGRRAGKLGMGCNLALFACKLLAGLASGSVAVIADGVNNLTDAASNVITLLGFRPLPQHLRLQRVVVAPEGRFTAADEQERDPVCSDTAVMLAMISW